MNIALVHLRIQRTLSLMHQRRTIIVIVALGMYLLAFVPLYTFAGDPAGILTMLPILTASWYFGRAIGVGMVLVTIPINMLFYALAGRAASDFLTHQWVGIVASLLASLGTSAGATLLARIRQQAATLGRERAALQAEIAERRQVEEALRLAKEAAESASRAKSAFLSHMSHELRTPLTAIIGYGELLEMQMQRRHADDLLPDVAYLLTASRHLLTLINNVLDLSKIEAEQMDVTLYITSVTQLLQEVATTAQPLVRRQQNVLHTVWPADVGTMLTDATKVRQILLNLLSNAAKFTHDGTITLRAEQRIEAAQTWMQFTVTDTGVGIARADLPHLFEPFVQGMKTEIGSGSGTGLGLAISARLCRLLGGSISAAHAPGGGMIFTVLLPMRGWVLRDGQLGEPSAATTLHSDV